MSSRHMSKVKSEMFSEVIILKISKTEHSLCRFKDHTLKDVVTA